MEKIQRANRPDKSSGKMKIAFGGAEKPQTGKNSFSVNKVNHSHGGVIFYCQRTPKNLQQPQIFLFV